jgi:hypothetical protein
VEDQESSLTTPRARSGYYVALLVVLWASASAVIITYFFFASFFPEFAPLDPGDIGLAILVVPGFCGFVMGVMLSEFEEKVSVYGSFVLTLISVGLIFLVLFLPLLTGTVDDMAQLGSSDEDRQAMVFSGIFVLPISLIGTVAGKAFGEVYLPSDEERAARRFLVGDTQKWHEMLQSYVREKTKKEKDEIEKPDEEKKDDS